MTREQFLLIKLSEECAEVSQRALKQAQFGANQIQTSGEVKDGVPAPVEEAGLTNAQRLLKEVLDFCLIAELLQKAGQLPDCMETEDDFEERLKVKTEKLNKYLTFARSLGQIDGDWMI